MKLKRIFISLILLMMVAIPSFAKIVFPVNSVVSSANKLYVPNVPVHEVKVYNNPQDITTATPLYTIISDGSIQGLALSPGGGTLYIASLSGTIKAYNSSNGSLLGSVGSFGVMHEMAVAPDGKRLYVVDEENKSIRVINTSDPSNLSLLQTISINVANLYGITVSPDGTWLVVTRSVDNGRAYIYKIKKDINGNITGYTAATTIADANLDYPRHVLFSADSQKLFVRVNNFSSSYDVLVFNVYQGQGFAYSGGIVLNASNPQDPINPTGEAMAISINGQYLYLTHYKDSSGGSSHVQGYRISTVDSKGDPRTDWTSTAGLDDKFLDVNYSIDGAANAPDGSKIWFTNSESGFFTASPWTGFANESGVTTPIPLAPEIISPSTADTLTSYNGQNNSGNISYRAQLNDEYAFNDHYYQIDTQEVVNGAPNGDWRTLNGFTLQRLYPITNLVPGHTYMIRVRTFGILADNGDGTYAGVWSPYTYSPQFTMANPMISSIQTNDGNPQVITGGYIGDAISIVGNGFDSLNLATQTADTGNYKITFYNDNYGSGVIPQANISNWSSTKVNIQIPSKFKDGTPFIPDANWKIAVTAYGIESNKFNFKVSPSIGWKDPDSGYVGSTVQIGVNGIGNGNEEGDRYVQFTGSSGYVTANDKDIAWDYVNSKVSCKVPTLAMTGPVQVVINDLPSNPAGDDVNFTVLPAPQPTYTAASVWNSSLDTNNNDYAEITEFVQQNWAYIYDTVAIEGDGFGSEKGTIKLGNLEIQSNFIDWSTDGKRVTFPVTNEAIMGNPGITLTNAYGKSVAIPFDIHPTIYSITPVSGLPHTKISISGVGFNDPTLNNSVDFLIDGKVAASTSAVLSNGVITTTVPDLLLNVYNVRIISDDYDEVYSNDDQTFAVVNPKITGFAVDTDTSAIGESWKDLGAKDSVVVSDSIKIKGSGFGSPTPGAADSTSYNVTINGVMIRDDRDTSLSGLQIYGWSDNSITLGIPHKAGASYMKSGSNKVVVTASGITASANINIRPNIERFSPDTAKVHKGSSVILVGTALESITSSQVVHFGDTLISNGVIARTGETPADVDGSEVSETLTFTVPAVAPSVYAVSVEGDGVFSNKIDFTAVTPSVTQIEVTDNDLLTTPLYFSSTDNAYGYVYSSLKITGESFGEEGIVKLGNITLVPNQNVWWNANKNEISVAVPRNIGTSYVDSGDKLSITNAYGETINVLFTVRPKISSLSKYAAAVGTSFDIKGYALGDAGDGDVVNFINDTFGNESLDVVVTSRDIDNDIITVILDKDVFSSKTGLYDIEVMRNSQTSNSEGFNVLAEAVPTITSFWVDTNSDPNVESWKDVSSTGGVVVYDTVKIQGGNFELVADGSRSTDTNNVTIDGLRFPDVKGDPFNPSDPGNQGYQVYSWTDGEIVLGIPRSVTTNEAVKYINAGVHEIKVTANGKVSNSADLTIKPTINYVNPQYGYQGITTVSISGEALVGVDAGSITKLYFGGINLGTVTVKRGVGDSMDGRGAKDSISVKLPSSIPVGYYYISAEVGTLVSVSKKDENLFNVLPIPVPTISSIQVKDDTWDNKYVVQSLDSAYGYVYSTISLEGDGFDISSGSSIVFKLSNGETVDLPSDYIYGWENKHIEFGIPRVITIQPQEGPSQVFYITPGQTTIELINRFGNKADLSLEIRPKIYGVSKKSVKTGDTIDVSGVAFGDPTNTVDVTFWDSTGEKVGIVEMSNGFIRTADIGDVSGNDTVKDVVVPDLGVSGAYTIKVSAYDDAPPYSNGKDVTFTSAGGSQALSITKVEVKKDANSGYVESNNGFIGYTVKMIGTGFEGNFDNQGKVKIDGIDMPVYSWNEQGQNTDGSLYYFIEFGLARSVTVDAIPVYTTAGLKNIEIVNSVSKTSVTAPFTIKPEIKNISPTNGYAGSKASIYGTGFGNVKDEVNVIFYDGITSVSTTGAVINRTVDDPANNYYGYDQVETIIPASLFAGLYTVVVETNEAQSNDDKTFTVNAAPGAQTPVVTKVEIRKDETSAYVATTEGYIGYTVKMSGTGFEGAYDNQGKVKIDGVEMPIYSWNEPTGNGDGTYYIAFGLARSVAVDPTTVYTTAGLKDVEITNNVSKTSATVPFTIKPEITSSISPTNGYAGSKIKIYGTGFGATNDTVTIVLNDGTTSVTTTGVVTRINDDPATSYNGYDQAGGTVPASLLAGVYTVVVETNEAQSNDKTFTVNERPVGQLPIIKGIKVRHGDETASWTSDKWANVYDGVSIEGTGFGNVPNVADRTGYSVTLGGLTVRDEGGEGLQIWSWSDTNITFGIPRKVGADFVKGGASEIIVATPVGLSASGSIDITPKIYGVKPNIGLAGDIIAINGTAFEGHNSSIVKIGGVTASAVLNHETGDAPDGINGNDVYTATVPASLIIAGDYTVAVEVDGLINRESFIFTVKQQNAPDITQITPNAATNEADISVVITGKNFQNGITIVLAKTGLANIVGVVTYKSATELDVSLPITGREVGKWDVVATNPDTRISVKEKGFTILDGNDPNNETAQIIDDFEGIAVKPSAYSAFESGGSITFSLSAAQVKDGTQAGSVTYPAEDSYRGYNGYLTVPQDISKFNSMAIWVNGDGSSGNVILQITNGSGSTTKNFAAVDAAGNQRVTIPLSVTGWQKYSISLSQFVQIGSDGKPVAGGAILNKSAITNYQLVFKGTEGTTDTVYIDFIAAEGYIAPVEVSPEIPRNLKAAKSGGDVALTWQAPSGGEPTTGYQVYYGNNASSITTKLGGIVSVGTYTATHTGAVSDTNNYYYIVKAVSGVIESGASNVAYAIKLNLTYNADKDNRNWISIPYLNSYLTIKDIVLDINGDSGNGNPKGSPATKITRLNAATQLYESYTYNPTLSTWIGSATTPVEIGEGFEIIISSNTKYVVVGGDDPTHLVDLTYNTDKDNRNWISIPYLNSYSTIKDMVLDTNGDSGNGNPKGSPATKITRLNAATQLYESYTYNPTLSTWIGSATTPVEIGEGFELIINGDVSSWKPSTQN